MIKYLIIVVVIVLGSRSNTNAQISFTPNDKAPKQLEQFQFLAGNFKVLGKSYTPDGYSEYQANWKGYYILNGFVFVDEFSIIGVDGTIYYLGITYRTYNKEEDHWEMRFFDPMTNEWLDNFKGYSKDGEMYLTATRSDAEGKTIMSKIAFYNITKDGFSWKSDRSYDNGKTWIDNFGLIEAKRIP